ncbi:MAG TPA: tetratricopeptide repeat protein, partial [Kofleriaceae bacterium]
WDTARKAKIQAALIATNVPYGEASALEVVRVGDRFADGFLRLRTGACNAHERGELETDAYALEAICFALRKRDLDAIVDRLETADPHIAAHAVDAMSTLIPVEVCNTREMQQLLVGPPDPTTRQAINHVIGGLHALRAARALDDDTVHVAALVAQVEKIEAPGVRAEVLELAGAYAAQIADYKDARVWLTQAADDAATGRHDLAEASALVNLIVVIGHDLGHREEADALRVRVETAVRRLHDHPEVELAWLQAEAVLDAGQGDLVAARHKLETAIALADRRYDGTDLRRIAPRQTMIDVLAQHGFAPDTRQYADSILAIARVILGPDHPGVATALVALGDSLASDDVENAVKSYEQAAAIAERALDSGGVADAIAHLAALQVRRGDLVASRMLYERAVHLDEMTRRPAHPATIAHRSALAALYDLLDRRADASKLYARVLADQRILYDHDDPRIVETADRVLAAKP